MPFFPPVNLGMNEDNNPLTAGVLSSGITGTGSLTPFQDNLITQSGDFLITQNGDNLVTLVVLEN